VESFRQRPARRATRSVKHTTAGTGPVAGVLRPVGCVATATDEDCTYVILVRRQGENLFQSLARLDQAIEKALTEGIFTDEINA